MKKRIVVIVLFVAAALAAGAQQARQRKPWYIGFGLGGGLEAGYTVSGVDVTFNWY